MEVESFKDAIVANEVKKKHLLLGNGFSRSYRDDIFSYDSLLNKAHLRTNLKTIFNAINTSDFEEVIRGLEFASTVVSTYDSPQNRLCDEFKNEADCLKQKLIETIAGQHPESPSDVSDYSKVVRFLDNFEKIYTLNYDLLLYWAVMSQSEVKGAKMRDDGFRNPIGENAEESNYVTWEIENTNKQNIYYLHGALHLFQAMAELRKFTWNRTGQTLLEQIKDALQKWGIPIVRFRRYVYSKIKKDRSFFLSSQRP